MRLTVTRALILLAGKTTIVSVTIAIVCAALV